MINLLPDSARHELRTNYLLRLGTFALLFAGVVLLFFVLALLPLHLDLQGEIAYEQELVSTSTQKTAQESGPSLDKVNLELQLLKQKTGPKVLTAKEAITLLVARRGIIRLEGIGYHAQGGTLSVRGTAPDRASLIAFNQALQHDPHIAKVDLPLATLLPEKNISFTMGIVMRPQ